MKLRINEELILDVQQRLSLADYPLMVYHRGVHYVSPAIFSLLRTDTLAMLRALRRALRRVNLAKAMTTDRVVAALMGTPPIPTQFLSEIEAAGVFEDPLERIQSEAPGVKQLFPGYPPAE